MVGSITSEVAQEILQQRNEVVADKVKEKRDREYVEKNRRYLGFTSRGGQVVCSGDSGSMAKLREHPEALELLKSLLHGDNTDGDFKFETNEEVRIPPCPFPLGVKERGHTAKNVEKFLVLLLNILDSGRVGGSKLGIKDATPPAWFTKRVGYKNYKNPSHASMEDNIDIIKGIFEYHGKDIKTHCLRALQVEEEDIQEDNEELEARENNGLNTSFGGEEEEESRKEAPQDIRVKDMKAAFADAIKNSKKRDVQKKTNGFMTESEEDDEEEDDNNWLDNKLAKIKELENNKKKSKIVFGSDDEEEIPLYFNEPVQSPPPSKSPSPLVQEKPSPRYSPNTSFSLRLSQPPSPNVLEELSLPVIFAHSSNSSEVSLPIILAHSESPELSLPIILANSSKSPEVGTILSSKPHFPQVESTSEMEEKIPSLPSSSNPSSNPSKLSVVASLKRKRVRKTDKDFIFYK